MKKPTDREAPTRFCPGCGSVGPIPTKFRDCCPDGRDARLIPLSLAKKCHEHFQLAIASIISRAASPLPVALPSRVREVLTFYAEGQHFIPVQREDWDTVSGEPQNFLEDDMNTVTIEDGSNAKAVLEWLDTSTTAAAPTDAAIEQILRCRYPVCTTINPSGFGWDTSRLNEVLQDLASAQAVPPVAPSDELALRRLLCLTFSRGLAYTDDGELSDSQRMPAIDFLRDTPAEIESKINQRRADTLTATVQTVLTEHSGCGSNTQVDSLTVRLNPGDKVVMHKGSMTQAIDRAALKGNAS